MRALTARACGLAVATLIVMAACGGGSKATRPTPTGHPSPPRSNVQRGFATWYGGKHHGGPTASGERFDKRAMTAAHLTLPMQTRVRVTNTRNGRTVVVRINDRGPYGKKRRIIDLSEAAAEVLGMIEAGVVPVIVEVIRAQRPAK
ncbi:MAG: rare lipoprotein [Deltaproteobacteria bacterium]|nr:rare lipoprotein [Deltaproteobacteria bacterium]